MQLETGYHSICMLNIAFFCLFNNLFTLSVYIWAFIVCISSLMEMKKHAQLQYEFYFFFVDPCSLQLMTNECLVRRNKKMFVSTNPTDHTNTTTINFFYLEK